MNQDSLHEFANVLRRWMLEAVRSRGSAKLDDGALRGHEEEEEDLRFSQLALRLHELQSQAIPLLTVLPAPPIPGSGMLGKSASRPHWTDIPALPIRFFKELDVSSIRPEDRTRVFFSSGTTGRARSRHHHYPASLRLYEDSARHWFEACLSHLRGTDAAGLRPISLTPPPRVATNSSLVHMFGTLFGGPTAGLKCPVPTHNMPETGANPEPFCGELRDHGNWVVNEDAFLRLIAQAQQVQQPVLLCGTAFSFVHVLDGFDTRRGAARLALPEGSLILETGGYKGRSRELPKPELHRALGATFAVPGTRIFCEYGMSELSSQAYEIRPDANATSCHGTSAGTTTASGSRSFRLPPWARFRIISPETGRDCAVGETGILTVYDLANVWSCMAIETEDLAAATEDGGFRLVGRVGDTESRGCSLMSAELNEDKTRGVARPLVPVRSEERTPIAAMTTAPALAQPRLPNA